MTPDLLTLTLAALLQTLQYAAFAIPANLELGTRYTGGSRDFAPEKTLSKRTARLQRALSDWGSAYLIVLGAIGIGVMLFARRGLWGSFIHHSGFDPMPLGHAAPVPGASR